MAYLCGEVGPVVAVPRRVHYEGQGRKEEVDQLGGVGFVDVGAKFTLKQLSLVRKNRRDTQAENAHGTTKKKYFS